MRTDAGWFDAGWLYLAVVLDVFSRRVVGWAMSALLETTLVLDALNMSLWNRRPAPAWSATLIEAFNTAPRLAARSFDYIEGWYNPRRRHSALGYRSPAKFELTWQPPDAVQGAVSGGMLSAAGG